MKKPKVVAGFPGIGKSYAAKHLNNIYDSVSLAKDSDSSNFSQSPDFPKNYIIHIEELRNFWEGGLIFVSTHKEVREELVASNIPFVAVYPKIRLREEYLNRYRRRNSPSGFIELVKENWIDWITDLQNQNGCTRIELQGGQYLWDALPSIIE